MFDKRIWLGALGCVLALLATAQAKALMIAPAPVGTRVATADLVVVGKVTGFGPRLVKSELFKGDTREMQIANVKVSETLFGKDVKEIKVGFFPPMGVEGGGGPRLPRRPGVQLKQDEESCLLLMKHPTQKDTFVVQGFYDSITKKGNPDFAKEVETIRKSSKLLAKPMDGLKAKDAQDRLTTASLLVSRYRQQRTGMEKTELVSAEESKAILEVLAEAEWPTGRNPGRFEQANAQNVFFQLGLTPKDGWTFPKDATKLAETAKQWCKDNAGKYRIARFVHAAAEEK